MDITSAALVSGVVEMLKETGSGLTALIAQSQETEVKLTLALASKDGMTNEFATLFAAESKADREAASEFGAGLNKNINKSLDLFSDLVSKRSEQMFELEKIRMANELEMAKIQAAQSPEVLLAQAKALMVSKVSEGYGEHKEFLLAEALGTRLPKPKRPIPEAK